MDPREGTPAGLRILIPGYMQWTWRQRERAVILFGSFVAALGMGVFAWGTRTGTAVLVFAFATHVVSAVDVFRQNAFPGFGRWMPLASASGGLALGIYVPLLAVATFLAWPVMQEGAGSAGFYVNCWAYHDSSPSRGDMVWLRWPGSRGGISPMGQIVAVEGQEVDWSANQLRIDGERVWLKPPCHSEDSPTQMAFRVPAGYVLVNPTSPGDSQTLTSSGPVMVANDQIAGRAWARAYPLRERQLLQ